MKISKILLYICTLGALFAIMSCSNADSHQDKPTVAVTTPAMKYIAEQIAGDKIDVVALIPEGVDAEHFEPDIRSMKQLDKADVLLYIDTPGFESEIAKKVKDIKGDDFVTFDVAHDVHKLSNEHIGGIDPHVLTSPANAQNIIARTVEILCRLYPEYKTDFLRNATEISDDISKADESTAAIIKELTDNGNKQLYFMSVHPSLGYFAEYYNIHQIPVEVEGKEPSPNQLEQKLKDAKTMSPVLLVYERTQAPDKAYLYSQALGGINTIAIDFDSADFISQYTAIANAMKK